MELRISLIYNVYIRKLVVPLFTYGHILLLLLHIHFANLRMIQEVLVSRTVITNTKPFFCTVYDYVGKADLSKRRSP